MTDGNPISLQSSVTGRTVGITCEGAFTMDLLNDIPIPLKNITVSFGYEAYFTSSNENEWIPALQEVQEKMLLLLTESSPLMQDGDVVSTTCDEIFQTAVPDLFLSTNNTVTRRTNSVDPWELFLGFLTFPEVDFDQDNGESFLLK